MIIQSNSIEENRFKTISDFKWCMKCGGEVQFVWNGTTYCCFGKLTPKGSSAPRMLIAQSGSVETNLRTEKWCDNSDEILEYMVGNDRLRDVITQHRHHIQEGSARFLCIDRMDLDENGKIIPITMTEGWEYNK